MPYLIELEGFIVVKISNFNHMLDYYPYYSDIISHL